MEHILAVRLLVALGIGGLLGIERERSEPDTFAGSRTLPLVALLGALVQEFMPDLLLPVFVAFLLLVTVAYGAKAFVAGDIGMTTAVATALTFVYGAMATHSDTGFTYAVILGILTTAVLAAKAPIHSFAERIGKDEMRDTIKFLILAGVVLPLLPNRPMDAVLGLNPRFVWLMVVFVSGISYSAYLLTKLLGPERGIGLTGLLGGFVSSTATAMSMSERARKEPVVTDISGLAIVVASMAMMPRVLVELSVVNRDLLATATLPLLAMGAVGVIISLALFWQVRKRTGPDIELKNPFRIKPALLFGAFFALILLVSEKGSTTFGDLGVYVTAVVSGLADVDAITLSLGRLAAQGQIPSDVATTGIILAAITNTSVKLGIAWVVGSPRLGKLVTPAMGGAILTGLVFVVLL